jgi:hypothetical protein
MKKWIYIMTSLILSSCLPCETITVENGPLPVSALKYVPYQNGETYNLKHSNGLIINFETIRETRDEWTHCTECCSYDYHFEVNSTRLIPNYPIFDCYFEISNRDTTYLDCYASIGKYGFYIPTSETQLDYFKKVDSLTIDSMTYYDVFKLKSDYGSYYDKDSIYADSLFYNFHYGILKIL